MCVLDMLNWGSLEPKGVDFSIYLLVLIRLLLKVEWLRGIWTLYLETKGTFLCSLKRLHYICNLRRVGNDGSVRELMFRRNVSLKSKTK